MIYIACKYYTCYIIAKTFARTNITYFWVFMSKQVLGIKFRLMLFIYLLDFQVVKPSIKPFPLYSLHTNIRQKSGGKTTTSPSLSPTPHCTSLINESENGLQSAGQVWLILKTKQGKEANDVNSLQVPKKTRWCQI